MPQVLQQVVQAVGQLATLITQLTQTLAAQQAGQTQPQAAGVAGGGATQATSGAAAIGAAGGCCGDMGSSAGASGAPPPPGSSTSSGDDTSASATVKAAADHAKAVAAKVDSGKPAAARAGKSNYLLGSLTPDQIHDGKNLSGADAAAACGPAAAVAFARFVGKDTSLDAALVQAKKVGWTQSQGMAGAGSEVSLLKNLGVKAHLENSVDWAKVKKTVMSGTPVIIDTPGHYWVAEQYNPKTGEFNFGKSGSVFKSSQGKTWFKPEEMNAKSGAPRSTIYLDSQ